ncbi:PREDICTED: PC-esterase domain-containing protein 1B-like, partial [Gekko japonicus]|uniref:PC-esterase domain-containing protein 1B-like n=1 Tax=Gekko japonicus TaxID=146911 RepID=A0ABM1LDJ8_GEKJA
MKNETTPVDILRANFEGATLASCYQFDVLDLNYCFRFFEEYRAPDGVHWNMLVHRYITKLLLTHVGKAWGVDLKEKRPQNGIAWNGNANWHPGPQYQPPQCHPSPRAMYANGVSFAPFNPSQDPNFQHDSIPASRRFSGYLNFEDDWEFPAHLE